jgi:aminomethyltransferase
MRRSLSTGTGSLAARNTLAEAKLLLCGIDMDGTTSVLETNLGWICKFQKGISSPTNSQQHDAGVRRILAGFEVGRGIARDHYLAGWTGRLESSRAAVPRPF